MRSYDADGSCWKEADGKVMGDFAIVKRDTKRFYWTLTHVPTGKLVGSFRLQKTAKTLAEALVTLPQEKWKAAALLAGLEEPL